MQPSDQAIIQRALKLNAEVRQQLGRGPSGETSISGAFNALVRNHEQRRLGGQPASFVPEPASYPSASAYKADCRLFNEARAVLKRVRAEAKEAQNMEEYKAAGGALDDLRYAGYFRQATYNIQLQAARAIGLKKP